MAERILDTAEALMRDRGYSAFSYADIAETVKIKKPSIHHHFPSKAGLVAAVLQRHRQRTLDGLGQLDRQVENPLDRLRMYAGFWEGCIRDRSVSFCVAALMAAELPSLPAEVQTEVRLHFQALSAWLEQTMEAGAQSGALLTRDSPATEAQTLMAIVHGAMLSARASGDCEIFKQVTSPAIERLAIPKN